MKSWRGVGFDLHCERICRRGVVGRLGDYMMEELGSQRKARGMMGWCCHDTPSKGVGKLYKGGGECANREPRGVMRGPLPAQSIRYACIGSMYAAVALAPFHCFVITTTSIQILPHHSNSSPYDS